jgi:hypothetical protein
MPWWRLYFNTEVNRGDLHTVYLSYGLYGVIEDAQGNVRVLPQERRSMNQGFASYMHKYQDQALVM